MFKHIFFANFPDDTLTRTLAGLTNPNVGIQNPTVKTIFNFNVGDIFHFSEGYSNFNFGGYEIRKKRMVIDKFINPTNDTMKFLFTIIILLIQIPGTANL